MKLDEIEARHTRAQQSQAGEEERELSLADIPKLIHALRQMRGEGKATHNTGVRELFTAREKGSGRLKVVFSDPEETRPQVMDVKDFRDAYEALNPPADPVYKVVDARCIDDKVQWQCRKCRGLIESTERRYKVENERGADLGEWCDECVVICEGDFDA